MTNQDDVARAAQEQAAILQQKITEKKDKLIYTVLLKILRDLEYKGKSNKKDMFKWINEKGYRINFKERFSPIDTGNVLNGEIELEVLEVIKVKQERISLNLELL